MVNAVLNIFEAQPLRESPELTKIEKKYPKYIPSFSLLRLQFWDYQFRQTFMTQILILFQSFKTPVNVLQKKYFQNIDYEKIIIVKSRIDKILKNDDEHKSKLRDDVSVDSRFELLATTESKSTKVYKQIHLGISRVLGADQSWVSLLL